MKKIYEISLRLNKTIPSKKRIRINTKYNTVYDPNKKEEENIILDIRDLLTEDDINTLKELKDDYTLNISLSVLFTYKTDNINKQGTRYNRVPDIDNILKMLMDAGNGILWYDDRCISKVKMVKEYAEEDATYINIKYYR